MKKQKTNKFMLLWYSHPRIAIAITLLAMNLVVIGIFTVILSLVSGNSFRDELAYLFTYTMCSDGIYDFVNQQEDVICFIIKIVLTIIQMVIFSGALIGFTTDVLQNAIDHRMENLGRLNLRNHFVFLNWSTIGPNIIHDLSYLEGEKIIVILSEKERDDILNSIHDIFTEKKETMKNIRLFIKNGDPNSIKHMSDISLDKAKYIGILLPDEEEQAGYGSISGNDLATFKLLLTILNVGTRANIVAEVESNDTVTKVETFLAGADPELAKRVSAFSHNSVIGHILGRTVITPTYAEVFRNVLSYDGCEFYGMEPMDVEEALCKYNNCIPIINYDDDSAVDVQGHKKADQLYIFAENRESVQEREEPRSFAKPLAYRENIDAENFVLYIFSDSDRAGFVVEEIDAYNQAHNAHIRYEIHSFREDVNAILENMNQVESYKKILLLSAGSERDACQDTEVFVTLLSMRLSGRLDARIPVFVELINPRSVLPLQKLDVASVIVSSKITSLFMVQLLTHPGSRRFYRDIVVANTAENDGNVDFDIVKAKEVLVYGEGEAELVFSGAAQFTHSFYQASGKSRMCIGLKAAGAGRIRYLCERTDEEEEVRVGKEDELVVVKYW